MRSVKDPVDEQSAAGDVGPGMVDVGAHEPRSVRWPPPLRTLTSDARLAASLLAVTMLGVAWVGAGLGCLLLVRDIPDFGFWAVMAVLFTVFAADTGAFFVGRTFGRHRLAPAISPAKSWEGFVAGVLAAVGMSFVILYKDRDDFLSIPESLLLGLVIALAAVLGDLFESAVKRDLEVKDSGRVLGGHGGVLDRIDSLLWAGPAAYFTILAFGNA